MWEKIFQIIDVTRGNKQTKKKLRMKHTQERLEGTRLSNRREMDLKWTWIPSYNGSIKAFLFHLPSWKVTERLRMEKQNKTKQALKPQYFLSLVNQGNSHNLPSPPPKKSNFEEYRKKHILFCMKAKVDAEKQNSPQSSPSRTGMFTLKYKKNNPEIHPQSLFKKGHEQDKAIRPSIPSHPTLGGWGDQLKLKSHWEPTGLLNPPGAVAERWRRWNKKEGQTVAGGSADPWRVFIVSPT